VIRTYTLAIPVVLVPQENRMAKELRPNVKGYTYHGFGHKIPYFMLKLWKKFMCARGWHAFTEVGTEKGHHFVCDACGVKVNLGKVTRPK